MASIIENISLAQGSLESGVWYIDQGVSYFEEEGIYYCPISGDFFDTDPLNNGILTITQAPWSGVFDPPITSFSYVEVHYGDYSYTDRTPFLDNIAIINIGENEVAGIQLLWVVTDTFHYSSGSITGIDFNSGASCAWTSYVNCIEYCE